MSLPTAALRVIVFLLLLAFAAVPGRTAEFVDGAGRRVVLPPQVGRVMAANQAAAVLVFMLDPAKLIGWPQPLSPEQRAYLPAKFSRLPVVGPLGGPDAAATLDAARRLRPDLIVAMGPVVPPLVAIADQVQQQTHIPYLLLPGDIQDTSETLRKLGTVLGVDRRGRDLRNYAEDALSALRGKLLISPASTRPRVYFGRGADGLETGSIEALPLADVSQAGAIDVAEGPPDQMLRVTPAQLVAWNPAVIIAERRSFYNSLLHSTQWRGLSAVRAKHVYLAPSDPFGWIDNPPGPNRLMGLYWLTSILYPDAQQEDLRALTRDFYAKFYAVTLTDKQLGALVVPAGAPASEVQHLADVPLLSAEPPPTPGTPIMPGVPANTLPMHPPGRAGLPPAPTGPAPRQ